MVKQPCDAWLHIDLLENGLHSGKNSASVRFFEGVPPSILYDNTEIAVPAFWAMVIVNGRAVQRVAIGLPLHGWLGRPGKGNDKVEGLDGYARRNLLVPTPGFATSKVQKTPQLRR
jgi:transposase